VLLEQTQEVFLGLLRPLTGLYRAERLQSSANVEINSPCFGAFLIQPSGDLKLSRRHQRSISALGWGSDFAGLVQLAMTAMYTVAVHQANAGWVGKWLGCFRVNSLYGIDLMVRPA
jgi:hypothetical protein